MNPVRWLVDDPLAGRVGWALLHSIWQGALIGAGFELGRFLLRRNAANSRYLLGCVAMVLLVIAPVLAFVWQAPSGESPAPDLSSPVVFASGRAETGGPLLIGSDSFGQRSLIFLGELAPWLTALWLAGVVFLTFKLARGWWWVGKIQQEQNGPVEAELLVRLNELRRQLGISRPVRLLRSALVEVPTVIGWLSPVILLPAASLAGLSPRQLEAILVHELAHVRRLDYLVNVFQNVVETVMFYHPVVWWISRCVRDERENCCDDVVVKIGANRIEYARALAALESFRSGFPELAFSAGGGSLLQRIRRLLAISGVREEAGGVQIGGLVLLAIGLVVVIAGGCLVAVRGHYESTARIRLSTPGIVPQPVSTEYLKTEAEIILSPAVLQRVMDRLNLDPAVMLARLETQSRVKHLPGTELFDIRFSSNDADEAARIANGIANAYREHRGLSADAAGGQALRKRLEEQQKAMEQAAAHVDTLRKQLNVSDPDPASTAPAPVFSAELIRQIQSQIVVAEHEQVKIETTLAALRKLSPSDLRVSIQTAVGSDSELPGLMNELNQAQQRLLALGKNILPDHPDYVAAKKLVDHLDEKVSVRVNGILIGLENRLQQVGAQTDALKKRLADAREVDVEIAARSRPYFEAKRELARQREFYQILQVKIASQETERPREDLVEIVRPARPSNKRVFPARQQGVMVISLGALLALGGGIMLRARPRASTSA